MSNTKTISTREFAEIVEHPHGNIVRFIHRMVNRGEMKARVSKYQNVPGGKKFDEYHLSAKQATYLNERLRTIDRDKWPEYVESQAKQVVVKVAKPRAATLGRFDVSYGKPPAVIEQQGDELTMSSLEIAELTEKDHKHVMRDIRKLLDDLKITESKFGLSYKDTTGRTLPCFALPRREVDILLTGYSTLMRAAVIDRWRELEAQVAKPTFNVPTSFAEALRLAGELEEQRVALTYQVEAQQAQIEQDKPKAEFYDDVADNGDLKGVSEVAKGLGTGEKRLFEYLRQHRILIGGTGDNKNQPFQVHIDAGRLSVKWNNYKVPETGEVKVRPRPLFTGKGITWLHDYIAKHGREGLG